MRRIAGAPGAAAAAEKTIWARLRGNEMDPGTIEGDWVPGHMNYSKL